MSSHPQDGLDTTISMCVGATHPLMPTSPPATMWDRVAETQWGQYLLRVETAAILAAAAQATPGVLVDVGCGSGRWSKLLADRGWKPICIDVDQHALDVCGHNVPTGQRIQTRRDAVTLPCASGIAAMVLCVEVAPVIESNWFLTELHRVLVPGGTFVGVFVNRHSWRGLAVRLKYLLTQDQNRQIYYKTGYSGWRERLVRSGFNIIREEGFCWAPFSRDSNSPLVPASARLERLLGLHRLPRISPWAVFVARKSST